MQQICLLEVDLVAWKRKFFLDLQCTYAKYLKHITFFMVWYILARWTSDGLLQSHEGGCLASTGGQVLFGRTKGSQDLQIWMIFRSFCFPSVGGGGHFRLKISQQCIFGVSLFGKKQKHPNFVSLGFPKIWDRFLTVGFWSLKDTVRLLPCDHTSDDQIVELGQTNGTNLVSFLSSSINLQLLPAPS